MNYFIRIRDIGKEKPDKFQFIEEGVSGKSLMPVGRLEKVKD